MWNDFVIFGLGGTIRLILICYGRIQDVLFDVKFTDVDYRVFVDAANHVVDGNSPFNRATYRYTPLIAWILTPCHFFLEFGKLLFVTFDLLNAYIVYKLCKLNQIDAYLAVILALFNPLTIVISSRGNAESLISFNVLLILYFLQTDRWTLAAILHGFAIHMKIYPVIYLSSVFFHFLPEENKSKKNNVILTLLCNFRGIAYILLALITFLTLTFTFYLIYGWEYLNESLLYHFSRTDIKHNFSPYFYLLYLFEKSSSLRWISLIAFIPQLVLVLLFSWKYRKDLNFCWFITTLAFVTFNKVCTSQYFVWYITFLPLILSKFNFSINQIAKMSTLWFGAQGIWLYFAYLLEFRGVDTFMLIWLSSLLFLFVNCWLIVNFVRSYPINVEKVKKS